MRSVRSRRDGVVVALRGDVDDDPEGEGGILLDRPLRSDGEIHHLLRKVGGRHLDEGRVCDASGRLRLVYPTPDWEDFVQLAVTEVRQFGGSSIQIARRLHGMLENLIRTLPEERTPLLREELELLKRSAERAFPEPEDRAALGGGLPRVSPIRVIETLLLTQLAPLCAGMAVRRWRPALAKRLQRPANTVAKALNVAAISLVLLTQIPLMLTIRVRGVLAMVLLLAASWTIGWVSGGSSLRSKTATAVATTLRNVGVSLVVATTTFPDTAAVSAVVAYGVLSLVGGLVLAHWSGSILARAPRHVRRSHA